MIFVRDRGTSLRLYREMMVITVIMIIITLPVISIF